MLKLSFTLFINYHILYSTSPPPKYNKLDIVRTPWQRYEMNHFFSMLNKSPFFTLLQGVRVREPTLILSVQYTSGVMWQASRSFIFLILNTNLIMWICAGKVVATLCSRRNIPQHLTIVNPMSNHEWRKCQKIRGVLSAIINYSICVITLVLKVKRIVKIVTMRLTMWATLSVGLLLGAAVSAAFVGKSLSLNIIIKCYYRSDNTVYFIILFTVTTYYKVSILSVIYTRSGTISF